MVTDEPSGNDAPKKPRHARGTGSNRVLGAGRFEHRLTRHGIRFTGYGAKADLALSACLDKITQWELRHGLPGNENLSQYMKRYLSLVEGNLAYRSLEKYRQTLRLYIEPALGTKPLRDVDVRTLSAFIADLRKRFSVSTVQTAFALLSGALRNAEREGLIDRNPMPLVRRPSAPRPDIQPLSHTQVAALLKALDGLPCEAAVILALSAAMRISEILGLRWQDVDLSTGSTWIRGQLAREYGQWTLAPLKNRRARHIYLPQAAVGALVKQQARCLPPHPWGLIFLSPVGKPLHSSKVRKQYRAALAVAQIPHQRFHNLRHTAASLLAESGLTLKETQLLLGHANVGITGNTYVHLWQEQGKRAASMMDGILPPNRA